MPLSSTTARVPASALIRDRRLDRPLPRLDASLLQPVRGKPCFGGTTPLQACRGACCVGGIWLDVGHVQRILAAETLIAPLLDPERRNTDRWFSEEVVEHSDFPSGLGTATAVLPRVDGSGRDGCVFVLADHRCVLQVAGMAAGMAWPGLKPFDCATFPVLLSEGELVWDQESAAAPNGVDCQLGGPESAQPPVRFYEAFSNEIAYAIGDDGLQAVYALAAAKQGSTHDD